MNRYLKKIIDGLDSEVAEIMFAVGEFAFTLTGAAAGAYQVLTQPTGFWWLALALCIYFGARALEELVYLGIDDEPPFGEGIYDDEEEDNFDED
jgi:hypothetical protein